jgi:hypothetical protein
MMRHLCWGLIVTALLSSGCGSFEGFCRKGNTCSTSGAPPCCPPTGCATVAPYNEPPVVNNYAPLPATAAPGNCPNCINR